MAFAIKVTEQNKVRYYSQTIITLNDGYFNDLILLTEGVDQEEVDISRTLIQAEEKLEKIKVQLAPTLKAKIVEFPEVIEYDQKESE
jgi:hypothetical protein